MFRKFSLEHFAAVTNILATLVDKRYKNTDYLQKRNHPRIWVLHQLLGAAGHLWGKPDTGRRFEALPTFRLIFWPEEG